MGYVLKCAGRNCGRIYNTTPLSVTIGKQDFTIELWSKPFSDTNDKGMIAINGDVGGLSTHLGNDISIIGGRSARYANAYYVNSNIEIPNKWGHIALVRYNETLIHYFNGKIVNKVHDDYNYTCKYVSIGNYSTTEYGVDGLISQPRFILGSALYKKEFIPQKHLDDKCLYIMNKKVYRMEG